MSLATERLELSVMAMTDLGRYALVTALVRQAQHSQEPHMVAFYNALASVCDQAALRLAIAELSIPINFKKDAT